MATKTLLVVLQVQISDALLEALHRQKEAMGVNYADADMLGTGIASVLPRVQAIDTQVRITAAECLVSNWIEGQ